MMSTPAIIWIVLAAMNFVVHVVKAGEPRGEYNPGMAVLDIAAGAALLWWGGFFAHA